jgi:hypothetical protein
MKKLLILVLFVCFLQKTQAQGVYMQTGKNFTKYDYKSDSGSSNILQSGSGNFYEIGYIVNMKTEKLKYMLGLGLNEYNAIGGNAVSSYSWNTQYIGVQNSISYAVLKTSGFETSIYGGLGIATLIYGKQNLDGEFLDLSSQKEFSGLLLSPKLGAQASYNVDNDIFLSLGYGFSKSYNITNNTNEKLSFSTNQIQFGVYFNYN